MSEEDRKSPGQEEVDEGAPFPPDEDEEEEEFVGRRRSGASRGFNASSFIDDQAEVSEDEAEIGRVAGDEEEDEGEEGDEQEVAQGFIVDEAEESGEEDIPEEKFADEPIELIDDDLDLIAENLGIRLKQKRKPSDSQESGAPKRRLQKIASRSADYEIEEEEFSDEDDYRTSRLDSMASIREQDELIEEREALGIGKGDIFRIFGDVSDFLREGNTAASIPLEELQPHVRAVVETGKPKSKITSSQELVISTDLPERYFKRDFTPEDCLEEERDWIRESFIDGLSFDGLPQSRRQAIETSLSKVLSFINLDKYEITYIGLYLEDYYKDFCDAESLWKILDLDDKFSTFLKRREALHKLVWLFRTCLDCFRLLIKILVFLAFLLLLVTRMIWTIFVIIWKLSIPRVQLILCQ
jgi:transcription elongation factor SPT6